MHESTHLQCPGQITFVPRAYWHDLENIGEEKVKFIIVYDNERPGDLGVSGSIGSLSARVWIGCLE
jgi:oxalate decarboxylase